MLKYVTFVIGSILLLRIVIPSGTKLTLTESYYVAPKIFGVFLNGNVVRVFNFILLSAAHLYNYYVCAENLKSNTNVLLAAVFGTCTIISSVIHVLTFLRAPETIENRAEMDSTALVLSHCKKCNNTNVLLAYHSDFLDKCVNGWVRDSSYCLNAIGFGNFKLFTALCIMQIVLGGFQLFSGLV